MTGQRQAELGVISTMWTNIQYQVGILVFAWFAPTTHTFGVDVLDVTGCTVQGGPDSCLNAGQTEVVNRDINLGTMSNGNHAGRETTAR
jgi:hypothetical protein